MKVLSVARLWGRLLLVSALLLMPGGAASAAESDRPSVVLDHLEFPLELGARKYRKHLERALSNEVRKADWGASSDSTIQYRFEITRLTVTAKKERVLTVSCSAVGRLPNGRSAASKLSFSGSPSKRDALVKEVLVIVARGVIARLAEIERVRRGQLSDQRVRAPAASE